MVIPIGSKNFLDSESIVAILIADSAPAMRLRRGAKKSRKLIDATSGRRARSVIVLKNNQIVLSVLQVETLTSRFKASKYLNREVL
jgi:regulator of extracellular matrix RemA (YlzA/DUF370 family)